MVGDCLYCGDKLAVPKTVEGVCTGVVAEPVYARKPNLLAVFVENFVAVGVQPVVALNRVFRALQQFLNLG